MAGALIALAAARPAFAQGADVIRGRVTGPDSLPIEGVRVTATSVGGNVNRNARTDKQGRFTITFPGGDGDYFVSFQALGYAPKRFEVKRTADQEILVADTRLAIAAQKLGQVEVTGDRSKVNRNDTPPDISGSDRPVQNNALTAEQMGDLAAMAASIPGVQLIPGADGDPSGFSVLGLGGDQNQTTLNGLNSGQTNLPRDAAVSSSLVTTPYDVSRGGFSGGQFNVRSRSGSNFQSRNLSLFVDNPALQWTDPAARALGQQYSNLSLGGSLAGPIKMDHAYYNTSFQIGRRANDLQTLLNTNALGLQTSGVARDSVLRLIGLLNNAKIPVTVGGIPGDRATDNASFFGALDWAPPSSTSGQALNITFNGSANKSAPQLNGTSEFPAHSGDRTSYNGGVQLKHTNFYGIFLSETSVGISASKNESSPYLTMPSGSVLVNSTFADGTNGVKTLSFGGSQFLGTSASNASVQATNTLSWFSNNNRHRLKLTTELRRDTYSQDQTVNRFGSYSYNSLTDFQNGIPALFTRSLSPRTRDGSQVIAGASLGDSWRVNDDVQLQYGVRADGNHFGETPTYNAKVQELFGVRNDRVPNNVSISPRLGFSWQYGTAPQIPGFEGAVRGPRAVVRGGIGMFQNNPATTLTGSALDNTGLASGIQQLTCVGAAVPIPDWTRYGLDPSTIPSRCADGSTGSVFSNSAPNVNLFAKDYALQRSLRSNIQWNGPILNNRFTASVDVTYSRNMNAASSVDLNFNPTVRFTLPAEGNRPIFARAASIVPATGQVAAADARISPLYNRVTEARSDLSSESKQITLRLSPSTFSSTLTWSVSYVYQNNRERTRGFQSTVGNPFDVEWARSQFDTRHQISYNLGYNFFDFLRVNWSGSFRSGNPYTPTISGDVNGDGYSGNDRAFIFDPNSAATDPTLAANMKSLLAKTSGGARACLEKQIGKLATRNSCEGPWTTNANLSFSFNPLKIRLPQRASLSFSVSNPLGAADLLVNGQNNLKGWGQNTFPDQQLLYVRGFDAATNKFRYDVNQRFGATSIATNAIRSPVVLTAQMRLDVGPTREKQQLSQTLDRGRTLQGAKMSEQTLKQIYGSAGLPNPMSTILRQQDTLKLTGKQADSLATMNRWYAIRLDSIWSPVAKYLSNLPDRFDHAEAYARYRKAREASVDLLIKLAPATSALLTPAQKRLLPSFIASYTDTKYLASIRSGTAGGGFGFGAVGDVGAIGAAMGGGGGERVIQIVR